MCSSISTRLLSTWTLLNPYHQLKGESCQKKKKKKQVSHTVLYIVTDLEVRSSSTIVRPVEVATFGGVSLYCQYLTIFKQMNLSSTMTR